MHRRRNAASVGSLLALLLSTLVVTAAPASAAEEHYPVPASGSWEVDGRGWGHGIGLSQWGAKGAAEQGLSYRQILGFYYPGTTVGQVPNSTIPVALTALVPTNTVTLWNPPTSDRLFVGAPGSAQVEWGTGYITVSRTADGYLAELREVRGGPVVQDKHVAGTQLEIRSGGRGTPGEQGLVVTRDQNATSGTWYRGTIQLRPSTTATTFDVRNHVRLEDYLLGVVPRESPSYFPTHALRSQAVAARSYVLAEGRSVTCDTTACQVYGGAAVVDRNRGIVEQREWPTTTQAVRDTAGEVRSYDGQVAFTQFSATNGGYSVRGSKPYLVAKPDPYSGTASGDTRSRWTGTLPVSRVQQHCPDGGTLRTLVVTGRDGNGEWGGRITSARVECTTGSATITNATSLRFGMFSPWWRPTSGPVQQYGFFLNDTWGGEANHVFAYGRDDDEVFVGDWDGDGVDTIALRRGNVFYISNRQGGGEADVVLGYGRPGDVVLVGDWDGDGKDTFAVRRGKEYHIRNSLSSGPAHTVVAYGRSTDSVLVGDWDGNGTDTLAVRRGAQYFVKNAIAGGNADVVAVYGRPDDAVLVGDWDADARDTLAVRRGNAYYMKNVISAGPADRVQVFGRATDEVLVGDWDGNGTDTLGVRRTP
ncbi:SpoIID/LytB domain-containing protein [Georgenia sp. H159]|uniref:SpoIID/LytB domain-containing protein n=1 Tax=Georgenia sp. H159 TaxID=3076115 RepID=UPI002D7940D5|nr:SpoIID/LytB domain-containing protein [Georgenia sp. H159]